MATTSAEAIDRGPAERAGERAPQPADYAVLNAVYGAMLLTVVAATHKRRPSADPIHTRELLPMGAATFALSKVIAREKMGTWVRDPFVDEERGRAPVGGRLRRAVGELVTCTRCVGAWSAMAVVGLRATSPQAGRTVTAILATSALNDFMQAGFQWVCAKSNVASD